MVHGGHDRGRYETVLSKQSRKGAGIGARTGQAAGGLLDYVDGLNAGPWVFQGTRSVCL
jgi:hypothetical protein